ncbi:hypothetical protein [Desulfospira joergensenii]|uniref:hypothetical protein n=1 Tax=Desulfospira joergensenii TaxID=53329 RepID=UPI0003B5DBB2|nr:hypothetical protein [Desulfospira joergensenii]
MRECKLCTLPAKVPDADIDHAGVCRFCREYEIQDTGPDENIRKERQEDLEKALQECRGQGQYDCLVPLSGGKDSIYLLYKLKIDYRLNVLAFTTNVNIPEIAWDNMRRALKKLEIDHISFSPSDNLYAKIFKYLLQNQEERGAVYTISYVYAPLFEGDAIKMAMEKEIPLILAGYSPGQPEPERMLYEFSRKLICETDWTPPGLRSSGLLTEAELANFFNPLSYPKGTVFPRYLAPFHAWEYNQDKVMKSVVKNKLVKTGKHASPIYSNYPINWLLMYSDLKHFGFNPYHPEFSALIREGKAIRLYWKIMTPIVNFMIKNKVFLGKDVTRSLKWLELDEKELRINMPKGTYDPIF